MKSHTKKLVLNVPARMDFVHITPEVEREVRASGVGVVTGRTEGPAVLREGIRPDTVLMIGQFDHWKTPFAKDLKTPSMNALTPMSLALTDSTGSVLAASNFAFAVCFANSDFCLAGFAVTDFPIDIHEEVLVLGSPEHDIAGTNAGAVAVWRHRTNIQRLRDGSEHRFTRKSTKS